MNEQALSRAIKNCLSGVKFDPARQRAVLNYMKEGKPMKRNLSFVVAVITALMLLGGTALAAGLGLFAQFAQNDNTNASTVQLNLLDAVATVYDQTQTLTVDGETVTLTLHQAYCDGVRLYYTYEIKGAVLGDGADLADGTPTMIYESDERELEDGTIIGYQTVELPDGVELGDTLDILLPVGSEGVPFTVQVHPVQREPMGYMNFGTYTANAMLQQTNIVLTGTVTLGCPEEWTDAAAWNNDGNASASANFIFSYVLMCHGKRYSNNYSGVRVIGDGTLEVIVLFDVPEDPTELILIPVYMDGTEQPDEAITLFLGNA